MAHYVCGHTLKQKIPLGSLREVNPFCMRRVKYGVYCYMHRPKPVERTYEDGVRDAAKAVRGVFDAHMKGNPIARILSTRNQLLEVAANLALELIGEGMAPGARSSSDSSS